MAGSGRRWGAVLLLLPLGLLFAGCPGPPRYARTSVSLGFGVSDVNQVEVYTYRFSASPGEVRRAVLTDRRAITTWVEYLTDLPVSPADADPAQLVGSDTTGFRFQLRNGTGFEVTQLFLGPQHSMLMWPDGTALDTDFGSPTGYAGELVEPDQRPRAVIE